MSKTVQEDFLKTFDDLVDVLTLSDENRKEMVREFMADAIDNLFQSVLSESVINNIVRKSKSDFAPENKLSILNSIIAKEQSLIDNLYADIASLQLGNIPKYYMSHFLNKNALLSEVDIKDVAIEIGLFIYLSGSIISYARKAQGALLTFARSESNRRTFFAINLNSSQTTLLYNNLIAAKYLDPDCSFDTFRFFFSDRYDLHEPIDKMKWRGTIVDLACLILVLSHNNPEWTVVERAFGVNSKTLKSTAYRIYGNDSYKGKLKDFSKKIIS